MLFAGRLRVAAGLTATLLLAGLGGSALASPTDQSVAYQLSPAHDGHMTDAGLDAPLTQQWSVTLPGAISYPLIVNGMVFVTAADGKLYGLSQKTGATVWSRDLDGGSRSGLTYDRGHVFATSTGGDLTAFDAATGTVAWAKHLGSEYFVTAAPTAAAGLVYAGAISYQMLYALRGRDGRLMWTRPVLSGDESSPAVDDDAVYAAYSCEQAHAFDRITGDVRWHHAGACSGGGGRTPAVADGKVFARAAGFGDNLVLSAATGAELGTFSAGPAPAVADGVAYLLSDTTLSAVADAGLGATAWTFTGDGHLSTAPLVVGDIVIVGSTSGMLYALDAAAGTTLWSGDVGTAIPAPTEYGADRPLTGLGAANGTLVVPAGDKLVAYRTAGAITAVPSNNAPPSIDGVAQVRDILAADVGIWTGLPGSYAYQWRLCDAAGASCADADGETDASFRPAGAHVGSTVRVRVVATNANGSSTAVTSAASVVVLASPPVNQVAPAIMGDAREGQTLTGSAGTWDGSPSGYAYQWRRCGGTPVECADIAGETTLSHVVTRADIGFRLVLSVVATNASGVSDPAESPSTAVVVPVVPVKQSPPTINGTPSPGQSLVAGAGVWSSEPTSYSIRWRRCNASGPLQCDDIAGATTFAHYVTAADVDHRIVARVVASNAGGDSEPADSLPVGPVAAVAPVNLTLPSFAGIPDEAMTLSADPGTWSNSPTSYHYQWFTCDAEATACADSPEATGRNYVVRNADIGRYVGVEVVATNAYGDSEPVASDAFGPVYPAVPRNLAYPSISGSAQEGQTLTAGPGSWSFGPTGYRYQWYSCDSEVTACEATAGATAATYGIEATMVGRRIGVGVIASNAAGDSDEEFSDLTDPVLAPAHPPMVGPARPPVVVPPDSIPPAPDSAIASLRIRARADGSLAVSARVRNRGKLTGTATATSAALAGRANARCRQACPRAAYGRRSATAATPGAVALLIRPTARARIALARHRPIVVRVDVTFQSALGGKPVKVRRSLLVRRQRARPVKRAVRPRAVRQQVARVRALGMQRAGAAAHP